MAITINGVVCQEIARKDGLRETVGLQTGPEARKGFLCNWADRYKVINGLLGLTQAATIGGPISVYFPARYPEINTIYCHSVDVEPVGSPTQGGAQLAWPQCIVWANYSRLPFFNNYLNAFDPKLTYCTQRLSSSCEWLTIPKQGTKFVTSGLPTEQDLGVRLALVELEVSFKQVPYLPAAQTYTSAGLINNATFLGVATGHLLYNGCQSDTATNYDGSYTQELNYSFTARSQRWDYAFDYKNNRWDQVVWPDGSTPFITTADFSTILPTYIQVG